MEKKIANYTYDTTLASVVKKVTFGAFGDTDGYEETLYAMPDGKLFLYTNGGVDSKHPTENIKRISKKEAEKFMSEN
ncbi:MAG: hypothetical protein SOZ62_05815 [Eubacteriales bacterium]|nr:hypothetical protein [Eubacteriales bacterium]